MATEPICLPMAGITSGNLQSSGWLFARDISKCHLAVVAEALDAGSTDFILTHKWKKRQGIGTVCYLWVSLFVSLHAHAVFKAYVVRQ